MLLGLTGCGGDDDRGKAGAAESSESSGPAEPSPCDLLSESQVEALAGEPLTDQDETTVGDLPVCVWGSLDGVGAQVGVFPASDWARELPGLVEKLQASGLLEGDDDNQRKLEEASDLVESGQTIPADEACGLFTDLVELNGQPEGSDRIVALFPSADDPQAVTGQSCRDGRYATVTLARPDLTGSADEQQRVDDVLSELTDVTAGS